MKRLGLWLLFVLSLGVILHIAALLYIPRYLTARAVATISAKYGGGQWQVNTLGYAHMPRAGADILQGDSPDSLISFAVLDVSSVPVLVHCVVPPGGGYWSVALFAANTDAFWVVNDQQAPAPAFDLVVLKKGSLYEPLPEQQVVFSPTRRAVMIVRTNVADRGDAGAVERLTGAQHQMWVVPMQGVLY